MGTYSQLANNSAFLAFTCALRVSSRSNPGSGGQNPLATKANATNLSGWYCPSRVARIEPLHDHQPEWSAREISGQTNVHDRVLSRRTDAPIMTDDDNFVDVAVVDDVNEVCSDLAWGVVRNLRGLRRAAVAEKVGRDDAVAGSDEERHLVAPVVCGGREAVHEQDCGEDVGGREESVIDMARLGQDVFVRACIHGSESKYESVTE